MLLVRRLARPMLASIFVSGGVDTLRNPGPRVEMAEPVATTITSKIPYLPSDTEQLVKLNAAVQVGAGALLSIGKVPRLAALALVASLVPTTLAGHRFWEEKDPGQKAMQQINFVKNLSLVGGLLLAAVDTEGQPGLGWRARHAGDVAGHVVKASRREANLAARAAKGSALATARKAQLQLPG